MLRTLAHLCLLATVAAGLSGCAFMSDEDRDFYGKGWVNPRELDTPMQHHAIPNPEAPQQPAAAPAGANGRPTSGDDEWTAPPLT